MTNTPTNQQVLVAQTARDAVVRLADEFLAFHQDAEDFDDLARGFLSGLMMGVAVASVEVTGEGTSSVEAMLSELLPGALIMADAGETRS